MEKLIDFIIPSGTSAFSPEVLIRYMVFVLLLSSVCSIAHSILKVGEKK